MVRREPPPDVASATAFTLHGNRTLKAQAAEVRTYDVIVSTHGSREEQAFSRLTSNQCHARVPPFEDRLKRFHHQPAFCFFRMVAGKTILLQQRQNFAVVVDRGCAVDLRNLQRWFCCLQFHGHR